MKMIIRLWVAVFASALAVPSLAQTPEPPLATLKAAAENGDAQAQDKLGDAYRGRMDEANALIWYRKAAAQGVAHSQSELGQILIGYANSPAATPKLQIEHAEEAIQCYLKAAQQGDKKAQLGLGRQFEVGKFLKQDYVEAYKWFALAAAGGSAFDPTAIGAKGARDALILKMSQEQITEGRKRVASFAPNQITKKELPEPAWVKEIKVQGFSGPATRRLVIINGQTFQRGDSSSVKAGNKTVTIRCIEVREASALISIEGLDGERELTLAKK